MPSPGSPLAAVTALDFQALRNAPYCSAQPVVLFSQRADGSQRLIKSLRSKGRIRAQAAERQDRVRRADGTLLLQ